MEEQKEKAEKPTEVPLEGIISEDEDESNLFNLTELGDIPLRISVQLGNTDLKIEEILKLERGSIIGIEKLAG